MTHAANSLSTTRWRFHWDCIGSSAESMAAAKSDRSVFTFRHFVRIRPLCLCLAALFRIRALCIQNRLSSHISRRNIQWPKAHFHVQTSTAFGADRAEEEIDLILYICSWWKIMFTEYIIFLLYTWFMCELCMIRDVFVLIIIYVITNKHYHKQMSCRTNDANE